MKAVVVEGEARRPHDLRQSDKQVAWWLFGGTLAIFLLVASGIPKHSDEISMIELARSMLYDGDLSVSDTPLVGIEGRGGNLVSRYGVGQPILSMPLLLLGSLVSWPLDDPSTVRDAFLMVTGQVASAATVSWAYLLGRRLGALPRAAAGVALASTIGSFFFVYATEYFAEPLVGLLLIVSAERVAAGRWQHAVAAIAVATVVHQRAAPVIAVLAHVMWQEVGLRRAIGNLWPMLLAVAALGAYNYGRFGDVTATGYDDVGFTTPLIDGLVGLFFTTSKSIVLFAPLAVVGAVLLPRLALTHPTIVQLTFGYALMVLVLTATWFSWMGGWSWGPRFLIPIVVLLAVPVAPWLSEERGRWGAVSVAALFGFFVAFPAVVGPSTAQLGPTIGPEVIDQYRLLPDIMRSGADGACAPALIDEVAHCMPSLWQVHVADSVGPAGDIVVVALTVALLAAAAFGGAQILRSVREAEAPGGDLAPSP